MATTLAIWNGTADELSKLRAATEHNCTCLVPPGVCAAHRMLLEQRILDGLVFVSRTIAAYLVGEHSE